MHETDLPFSIHHVSDAPVHEGLDPRQVFSQPSSRFYCEQETGQHRHNGLPPSAVALKLTCDLRSFGLTLDAGRNLFVVSMRAPSSVSIHV